MNTYKAYHGTDKIFSEFSNNVEKRSAGSDGGFWFSENPLVANSYCISNTIRQDVYFDFIKSEEIDASQIIIVNIIFKNPLVFDAKGNDSGDLYGYRKNDDKKWLVGAGQIECYTIADLFNKAINDGYDGVIVHNCYDSGNMWANLPKNGSTIFGIKSCNQIN